MVTPEDLEKLKLVISRVTDRNIKKDLAAILRDAWKSHAFEQQVRLLIEAISQQKISTDEAADALIKLHHTPMQDNPSYNMEDVV